MAPKGKDRSNIPVNFFDSDGDDGLDSGSDNATSEESADDQELTNTMTSENDPTASEDEVFELDDELEPPPLPAKGSTGDLALNMGGPEVA